ncbi:DUF1343 domain-containing protein [Flavobacteriaceae bacterium 3-367]|uniref:exo-beta-N-acetylmuramidase NamZ family protein n=1 Tax=Eudoraea algarum TaxID=3417568 RepID=UPI00326A800B
MVFLSGFKNTVLLLVLLLFACANQAKKDTADTLEARMKTEQKTTPPIVVAANRTGYYLPLLKGKRVGVVANQTSVIFKNPGAKPSYTHLVDSLLSQGVNIKKVFAPEHGFRGQADAGEVVVDGVDTKTGLPLISLYGKNKKPSQDQLEGLELVVFDIQDVGVRFYTYIATLQLVMEACAEKGIPLMVLDRPNPNGHYVDGPRMKAEHRSFLGMNTIPLVYGMTMGEYAQMLNGEGWLEGKMKVDLTVVALENYTHERSYDLPIRPSPNLPNDIAINLYPSTGLFEGTHLNAGRGTEFQFQRFGAPFLDSTHYILRYTPQPNFGSKYPKQQDKLCYGKDLSDTARLHRIRLDWLIEAYTRTQDKAAFFNTASFTKHVGTPELQQQIEAGISETEIRKSWEADLESFRKIRSKYLLYK